MENKTVFRECTDSHRNFFFLHFFSMLRLLDDVTQLSLNNVRLLWGNKKRQKLIQEGKEMSTKMHDR